MKKIHINSRAKKLLRNRWAAFIHDLFWVPVTLFLAYWVRFNFDSIPPAYFQAGLWVLAVALPIQAVLFWHYGLYRGIWRFASIPDVTKILTAVCIGTLLTMLIIFIIRRMEDVPRSILLLYPIFLCLGLAGPRLLYRFFKDKHWKLGQHTGQRALIVGAGRAGELLVRDLFKDAMFQPVGFVDDDPEKRRRDIHGVRVMGKLSDMERLVEKHAVDIVLLAIPSAESRTIQHLVQSCYELQIPCRTLPSITELVDGRIEVSRLREIQIEDLLGRKQVRLDIKGLRYFLADKRVLITGAGGSIGSELCRQVAKFAPEKLILLDHSEYNLYCIEREMLEKLKNDKCISLLGDVRDHERMRHIFDICRPQVVFHAAAYKHVPMVEQNPIEGIKTNVLGTKEVADLAVEHDVEKFVLVSTDKAVNPRSIMGASKRVAEIYCQNLNDRVATRFITTRFGNVLGSTGSVVPLFREQIAKGGPVTVTHPDMTRYFMTIPEACQLILQAGAIGHGGEIFVLDMGEPVSITDLAKQMIRLSGLEIGRDIEISFTGMRLGEKLHEELFHTSEHLIGTQHPKIMLATARSTDWKALQAMLGNLEMGCGKQNIVSLRHTLKELVPEFIEDSLQRVGISDLHASRTLH